MKVILVDDSTMVRARLTTLLSGIAGVQVIGHAGSETEAVELIVAKQPDAVVLDISLESGTGLGVLQRLQATNARPRVIMLTNETASRYREKSLELGAHAFFDKSMDLLRLVEKLKEWL